MRDPALVAENLGNVWEFAVEPTYQSPDEAWRQLSKTIEDYQVALFLGAGVSTVNRMPSWRSFIQTLGGWTSDQMEVFEKSGMSLISLCEIAKRGVGSTIWSERVRTALYGDFLQQVEQKSKDIVDLSRSDFSSRDESSRRRVSQFFRETNPVLWDVVSACGRLDKANRHRKRENIGAFLTTNIDCLPQLCDRAAHTSRMIRTVERAATELDVDKIPIYQLHGYLLPPDARTGMRGEASDGLVLTESEYLARTDGHYAWANVTLHFAAREMPIIFIGCSMTDDLIRRALLRSCRERMESYAAARPPEAAKEYKFRRHFAVMHLHADEAVNRMRNVGAGMLGVWPLWVSDFHTDLAKRIGMVMRPDSG
ncbi:SIR2 family protein [Variovorax sp. J22P240]|uniref:SIR2 family protein n=1 Tax=Variovorax sp. J22P240 TaxID=3053514 RepID=UPI0025751E45|nr:SIR2 family protein [Variovorax sp. J22P240]MDM0002813.1 SIR2 family protein [Variovorax sp. J22P240]